MEIKDFLLSTLPLGIPPKNWEVVHLKDITSKIGSGATPRGGANIYQSFGISLIRSQNVHEHKFKKDGLAYIDENEADKLDNVVVQAGDILLNITGDSIARCCLVPNEILPARVNQHVVIIRPTNRLNSIYLQKYLSLPQVKNYMLAYDAGATRKSLTKGNIENFLIPLPPLSEQKAIAHILSSLDDKIELNQQINETLEAMARAIFKSWFVDFDPVRAKMEGRQPTGMDAATADLFPDEFEESSLGLIPKGWGVGKLEDLIVLQRGFDLPAPQRIPGKYPVIAASGPSGTHNEYKVKGPGVTTGRSGVLGKVFFVYEDFWPLNTSLWIKEFRNSRPIYAYHLISLLEFETFNAGSAVPTLNRNHVHSLFVNVPPMSVIEAFENIVISMFYNCRENNKQSRTLTTIRDTLLPKLMSGEIQVKEVEKIIENLS